MDAHFLFLSHSEHIFCIPLWSLEFVFSIFLIVMISFVFVKVSADSLIAVLCCFNVFLSLNFVDRGCEFVVKQTKKEGFEFGPVRNCQEKYHEKVGFGM